MDIEHTKPEVKVLHIPAADFKLMEEGAGGFSCLSSPFGELDDGGDIAVPGSYRNTIPQFLKRGFTPTDHDWSFGAMVAYPTGARETERGLVVDHAFHSTEDAQDVRTKMRERIDAGLDVAMSIGYRTLQAEYLSPAQYATELPKYLRPEKLAEGMAKCGRFAQIRLLKETDLFEDSPVTLGMARGAGVESVKSAEGRPEDTSMGENAKPEVKAQYLGDYTEKDATMAAMRSMNDAMMWRVVEPAVFGEGKMAGMPIADRMAAMKAGMDEFRDLSMLMCEAMIGSMEGMDETGKAALKAEMKALWPASVELEAMKDTTFERHAEAVGSAVGAFAERAKWVRDARTKEGRQLSQTNRDRIDAVCEKLDEAGATMAQCSGDMRQMMADQDPGKSEREAAVKAAALKLSERRLRLRMTLAAA